MSFLAGLYDPIAERLYEAEPGRYVGDSTPPTGLSAVYDYEALRESVESFDFLADGSTLSRFLPLLPLKQGISIPSADPSPTPVDELSLEVQGRSTRIRLKDEGAHRGGTIWDRGAVVALSMAREWSRANLILPGDGPVSRCVNRYALKADLERYVLREDPGSRLDASLEGATGVHWRHPEGPGASRKVLELAEKYDLYPGVPGWNPYFVEGLKTVAYELAEQSEPLPEVLYVTTESRLVVHAVTKGFRELSTLGWFEELPEVVQVVAPEGRNPDRSTENEEMLEALAPRDSRSRRMTPSESDLASVPGSVPRPVRLGLAAASTDSVHDSTGGTVTVLSTGSVDDPDRSLDPRTLTLDGTVESLPDKYLGTDEERSSWDDTR